MSSGSLKDTANGDTQSQVTDMKSILDVRHLFLDFSIISDIPISVMLHHAKLCFRTLLDSQTAFLMTSAMVRWYVVSISFYCISFRRLRLSPLRLLPILLPM